MIIHADSSVDMEAVGFFFTFLTGMKKEGIFLCSDSMRIAKRRCGWPVVPGHTLICSLFNSREPWATSCLSWAELQLGHMKFFRSTVLLCRHPEHEHRTIAGPSDLPFSVNLDQLDRRQTETAQQAFMGNPTSWELGEQFLEQPGESNTKHHLCHSGHTQLLLAYTKEKKWFLDSLGFSQFFCLPAQICWR